MNAKWSALADEGTKKPELQDMMYHFGQENSNSSPINFMKKIGLCVEFSKIGDGNRENVRNN